MQEEIAIVLASYNGEKYILDQINSIINQSYHDWHLFIRDDGSSDNTLKLEKNIASKYPQKITVFSNQTKFHGPKHNFFTLSKIALNKKYKYVMFCDQDDVWKNNKVESTYLKMKNVEKASNVPTLIHSDLGVVDENLNVLGSSFMRYRALDPATKDLNHLLIQNNVTGCTMMVNRALLEKALQFKDIDLVAMHDWWFALIACIYGNIGFLDNATICYRQHGGNVVGATKVNSPQFIIKRLTGSAHVRETLHLAVDQAKLLVDTYSDIPQNEKTLLKDFSNIYKHNKFYRMNFIRKNNILKQGKVQIIGEFIFI